MQSEVYRLTRTNRGANRGWVSVRVRTIALTLNQTNDLFVSFLEDVRSVYRWNKFIFVYGRYVWCLELF